MISMPHVLVSMPNQLKTVPVLIMSRQTCWWLCVPYLLISVPYLIEKYARLSGLMTNVTDFKTSVADLSTNKLNYCSIHLTKLESLAVLKPLGILITWSFLIPHSHITYYKSLYSSALDSACLIRHASCLKLSVKGICPKCNNGHHWSISPHPNFISWSA